MKSLIQIFLIAFLSIKAHAQTPNYFGNQPSWSLELQHSGEGGIGAYSQVYVYQLFENETYDGYYQIKYQYEKYEFDDGAITAGTLTGLNVRQEGRAIYYYNEDTEEDELFISYELELGDTVKGLFGEENFPLIVYSIDSVLVGDAYRKLFFTDETPDVGMNRRLIEGIGYQYNDEDEIGGYFADLHYAGEGIGFDMNLHCYGEYTVPLWNYPDGGTCNLTLNFEDIKQINNNISTYPNPAVNLINFAASSDIKNIIIYNLGGGTVKETSVNDKTGQINLTDFSRGIYIAKVTMEDESLLWKKIVLQ